MLSYNVYEDKGFTFGRNTHLIFYKTEICPLLIFCDGFTATLDTFL